MKSFAAAALLGLASAITLTEGPAHGTEGPKGPPMEHDAEFDMEDFDMEAYGTEDMDTALEEISAEDAEWLDENLPGWGEFTPEDWENVDWEQYECPHCHDDDYGYGDDTYGDDYYGDYGYGDYDTYGDDYGYGDDYYGDWADHYYGEDYGDYYGEDHHDECFMDALGGALYEHGLIGDDEVAMWEGLDEDEKYAMGKWAFGKVDGDDSGSLSMEEGIAGLRHVFPELEGVSDEDLAAEIGAAVGHFDHNEDGELDWSEITGEMEHDEGEYDEEEWEFEAEHDEDCFMNCLAHGLNEHGLLSEEDVEMWESMDAETQAELGAWAFGEIDADGSGDLDAEEGVAALQFLFPELAEEDFDDIAAELGEAVGHFDKDGNGALSWGEITGEETGDDEDFEGDFEDYDFEDYDFEDFDFEDYDFEDY